MRHIKPRKSFKKSMKKESSEFNKAVAYLVKQYWPDAVVHIGKEEKSFRGPDILIERLGLKIPIEVKSSKVGYFYIGKLEDGGFTVFHDLTTNNFITNTANLGAIRRYDGQVDAYLRVYGISVFLINGNVRPTNLNYRISDKGLIILGDFPELEHALEKAYEFLSLPKHYT